MRFLGVILMAGLLGGTLGSAQAQPQQQAGGGIKYAPKPTPNAAEMFDVPGFAESMEGRLVSQAVQAASEGRIDDDQMMSIVMPAIRQFNARNAKPNGR